MNIRKKKISAIGVAIALVVCTMSGYTLNPEKIKAAEVNSAVETIEAEAASIEESAVEKPIAEESATDKEDIDQSSTAQIESEETTEEITTTEKITPEETTTEEETTDPAEYRLIAHRGYSGFAPENSMPAFEKAIAAGFKMIELDVIRCKPDASGKATWVISHNNSLKSTMGVNKNITDMTYNEILSYSYTQGNQISSYSNLKIVSLEQIITYIKLCKDTGNDVKWQIEIKDVDQERYTEYFEEELVKPIVEAGIQDCVVFSSFNYTYLRKIKEISNDQLKTWFLSTILNETALERAEKCKAKGISFKGTVTTTTKEMIQAALDKGYQLGVYTINSQVVMGTYYQFGVRQFATDMLSPMEVSMAMMTGTYNAELFTCTLSKTSYTYDGGRKLPKVTVTYRDGELIEGLNYTLSYENNKNPGTAKVYISGINNCIDETSLSYQIKMPEVEGFQIKTAKTKTIQMSWNKVDHATGYIVYSYNFTTKKYTVLKTIEKNTTTSYKAKKLSPATKYKYRVKAYVKADGKTFKSSPCSAKTAYTRPVKASITSTERYKKHKRLRVKWKKVNKCSGYQVKIATDKAMKKIVGSYQVVGSGKTKLKIKKLSKNKAYYVKVRAYLKNGSNKVYGVYSNVVKSKKAKK